MSSRSPATSRRSRSPLPGRRSSATSRRTWPWRWPDGSARVPARWPRPSDRTCPRTSLSSGSRWRDRASSTSSCERRGSATCSATPWAGDPDTAAPSRTAGPRRSSSCRRTRPARCTWGTRATRRSATRSPACSRRRGGGSSASTTSTTPVARWTGSAPRWRLVTCSSWRARRRCRRTVTTATTSSIWPGTSCRSTVTPSRTFRPRSGWPTSATRGRGGSSTASGPPWTDSGSGSTPTSPSDSSRSRGRSTQPFGDDKDRPLIRSNGTHTYFAADCAYVVDKFARGFDRMIYVWGADHHGDVVRVKGAARAMGFDPSALEMVIYQFVSFLRGGQPVKMSKRAGTFITLDELIDEVGTDAARFTLLMHSNDSPMNFDIEDVKRRSMDNPVYYVQYGHARIASILRNAEERGVSMKPIEEADLSLLSTDAELDLLRTIAEFPDLVLRAAELRGPHRLAHYAQQLAAGFHRFYTECRVITDDQPMTQARLWLSMGAKQAIANVLTLLGVSAPESMERIDV